MLNCKQTLLSVAFFFLFASSTFAQEQVPLEKLIEKLGQENDPVDAISIVREIRKLGPKAAPAIDALLPVLKDVRFDYSTQIRVCSEAAKTLKAIGPSAVDQVIREIKATKDPVMYHSLALAIQVIGEDAKAVGPFLNQQLKEATGQKQYITMYALAALGDEAVPAIPVFSEALNSKDFHFQSMGCDCLAAVSAHKKLSSETVEQILLLVEDGVVATRMHAARSLGAIGAVEGFDVVENLLAATQDRQTMVRDAALRSLAKIGKAATKALPKLREMMIDKKYGNRVQAARAVWLIDGKPDDSVRQLLELIEDSNQELDCIDTFAEMKSSATKAIPRLAKFLDSDDPDLRMQSVRAIGQIGTADKKVLQAVKKLTSDDDPDVKKSAAGAWTKLNKPELPD